MGKTTKGFRRGRVRSKRVRFWQVLGRITLELLVLARLAAKLVEIILEIINKLRH